jgi:hypothetical protein
LFIFEKRANETDGQVLTRAKAMKQQLLHKGNIVEILSRKIAFAPPKGAKLKRHEWWCPYCCKPRVFVEDSISGYKKCCICGISTADFYVKKYNADKYPSQDRIGYLIAKGVIK